MTQSGVSPAQWSALSQLVAGHSAEMNSVSLVIEIAGVEIHGATIDALVRRGMIVRNGASYIATKHGRQELRKHHERIAASRSNSCSRKCGTATNSLQERLWPRRSDPTAAVIAPRHAPIAARDVPATT